MLNILNKKQKKKFFALFIIMFLGAGMELLGVSLIMPLVNVVSNADIITTSNYALIGARFGLNDVTEYISFFSTVLIGIYIVKNAYLTIQYDLQYRFVYNSQKELMVRILNCYLGEEYLFHVKHSPTELQRNIINDVETAFQSLLSLIQLLTEILVCGILVAFLFYTDAVSTTLIVLIFLLFGVFFALFYKKYSYKLGINVRNASANQLKWVNQSLSGIRELKVTDTENYFIAMFGKAAAKLADSRRKQSIVGVIPRPILETVMICGLLAIIMFRVRFGADISEFIPILSIYAISAFRMLPSFSRITNAYNNIMYSKAAVNAVYEEINKIELLERNMEKKDKTDAINIGSTEDIVVCNLNFRYGEEHEDVLNSISMCFKYCESTAIIGESGSGKSTLADLILGILKPTAGDIIFEGKSIYSDLAKWHKLIGYVPQTIYLIDDTIRRNIAFGVKDEEIDEQKIWKALQEAQLDEFVKQLEDGLDTSVGDRGVRLSGGQRQRIGIARALYNDPKILILDEATSALDTDTENALMEAIDKMHGNRTLIIIAHRLTTIKNCDRIYKVENHKTYEIKHNEIFGDE